MRRHRRPLSFAGRSTPARARRELSLAPRIRRCCRISIVAFGLWWIVSCAVSIAFAASDTGEKPAWDSAFQALTQLELGQNLGTFGPIEQAVAQSRTDEKIRVDLETRFLTVLQSDATDLAKDYACRQLVIVGSDASIPVLAALLPKERSSFMARYALEGIGSETAIQALRDSLGKTSGRQKVGVVIALGRLADTGALPALSALLGEEDRALREATLIALGRIGTVEAAQALRAFADKAPETLKAALIDAELQAAERLCRQGKLDAAVGLYETLAGAESERVRAAAFRGLTSAKPSETLSILLGGLAAKETWKRAVAADCVLELTRPEQIQAVASAVPELPDAGKIAALIHLKDRPHPAVRAAALKFLNGPNTDVRVAALETLIVSGTVQDVPTLARLATASEDARVRAAAFQTLRLMTGEGTNPAVRAWMSEDQNLSPVMVQCALARRSTEFVPVFLQAAASSHGATRLEAFKALEIMATEQDAELLVHLLSKTSPGDDREAADRAVWMTCQKIANPAQRSAPLLAAMAKADAAGQCAILPSLARMGGEGSLTAVRSAMESPNQAVRDAGHRALANWPDASVAEALLNVVKTSGVESYRISSLRAYARVVALPNARPPQKTFEMLADIMALAKRNEDRKLILSRMETVRVPEALAWLLSYLDHPELKDAAVPAVFTLAKGLSQSHPDQAKTALQRIQPLTKDAALLQQIPKVLRDIEARKGNK